jgi:hypothetical protein
MTERRLLRQIEKVAGRLRHRQLLVGWIATWLITTLAALALVAVNRLTGWYEVRAPWILTAAATLGAMLAAWFALRSGRNPRQLAQHIETSYPELNTGLLAAVDQQPELPNERFGFLQSHLIDNVLGHAYGSSWLRTISPWQLLAGHFFNVVAFAGMVAFLVVLPTLLVPARVAEVETNDAESIAMRGEFEISVEPGSTEVEHGTSLLVMARFAGVLPPEATLSVTRADGGVEQFAMSKSLEDPVFGARIPDIRDPLWYRVEFVDQETDEYQVTVFEYPRLVRADAQLAFPDYTSLDERVVQDVRTLSAVEKTHLKFSFRINKPTASAELVDRDGNQTELQVDEDDPLKYTAEFDLNKSLRLELRLKDQQGRANKQPPEFVINTLPNKPPDLKLVQPSRDLQVSPLEEVHVKANVWDDFGLSRIGLIYMLAEKTEEVVLAQSIKGKERTTAEYLLALENLEAEPDQLVTYYFWAEDSGPDGNVRRVSSDMYFAEVRHFEEVFREGEAPPGGGQQQGMQGGAGGQSQQLAELQKQIINGTWNVIRRETAQTPSSQFSADVRLLVDSQTSAMEQAEEMNKEIEEGAAMRHILDVRRSMLDTIKHLSDAETLSQPAALTSALASEQRAYQALLRLRATEHQVARGNQNRSAGGGGGGGNRAQRQLDQLQLRDNESRYETESQAGSQQEQQDSETRQVMNRLRELARRQGDLNERLKELQSALEEAKDEKEEDEIRRQLQRLREEQERILRDIDDVRDRMDRPENQERMADQQQQLDQTRDNVRQASEALEEGRLSQAVTAGTRAEREFENLRDEFRRQSSGRFQEEMREMREEAQELESDQQEIADRLEQMTQQREETRSLRDTGQNEEVVEDLAEQRARLEQLLTEMRDMVQESEASEPLLAGQLYDAARDAIQERLPEVLQGARRSVQRGFLDDAKQLEERARSGISELREGVERAAEHVLGDETEALRKAREELQRLTRDLDQEIERLAPQANASEPGGREGDRSESSSQASGPHQPSPDQPADPSQQGGSPSKQQGRNDDQSPPGQPSPGESGGRGQRSEGSGAAGENSDRANEPTDQLPNGQQRRAGERRSLSGGGGTAGGTEPNWGGLTGGRDAAPLTGDDFLEWSDRLRNVEEMISDPELRAEAARIRDRARGVRSDIKRHSRPPNWDSIKLLIATPLAELQQRVSEELIRRTQPDSLVPIDRDPVPPKFSEQVQRYYEQLGSGK